MICSSDGYVKYLPILKWRQGEYQALLRLDPQTKENIYPLFVVPPVEYDFEEQRPKKSPEEHVEKLATRYKQKWGLLPSLVDIDSSLHLQNVQDGRTVPEFIFDELKGVKGIFSPVVKLDYDKSYLAAVKRSWQTCNTGIGIRISLDELASPSSVVQIASLQSFIGCTQDKTDLIIDFGKGASYEPTDDVILVVKTILGQIDNLNGYRSIYVVGTSLELGDVKKPGAEQARKEWIFFQALYRSISNTYSKLGYGDYTIETPEFTSLDMRMLKPAAKIVYSYKDKWIIYKGGSFRDNPAQMKGLCKKLITAKENYYYGRTFSQGDEKIYDCGINNGSTGTLGTWKEAAISHHLTLVVIQNASLHGF
ncbi:beta family protein [Pseudoalteromonas sp. A757]|uniref:beta family protein n=1 Tax=Pseudoalteromonas sp. A757 TaxID=2250709 RepID=UPI000FFE5E24|nr:beta family protein [Pseudoalteromonas sp. A757]RXE84304.1 hypothetical protein DRB05_20480 [Pseudoalteromonas sp. A757]